MRLTGEESPAEIYARLSMRQKNAMQAIIAARREVEREENVLAALVAVWQTKVFEAVNADIPVRFLATELALSQSRIYQIRDLVAGHRDAG